MDIREQLEELLKDLKRKKDYADRWNTEEMLGMSYVYDEVITKIEDILSE